MTGDLTLVHREQCCAGNSGCSSGRQEVPGFFLFRFRSGIRKLYPVPVIISVPVLGKFPVQAHTNRETSH